MTMLVQTLAGKEADARGVVAAGALLVIEGLLILVMASLLPRAVGAHGEIPSVWTVFVLLGLGALLSYRLGESELPGASRWALGVVATVVAIQVVARVDLSETARIWSFGWALDLTDPDSGAWRGSERLDHVIATALLALAWFRGAALGNQDLTERSLPPILPVAVLVFAAGFLAGDATEVLGRVRAAALAFLAVALLAVAFRNARRLTAGGGFGSMGVTFLSTFGAMTAVAIVFMLVVTLLVAAVGGTGLAEPVTDALGVVLRAVAESVAWVIWTLLWPIRQLANTGQPIEPQQFCFTNDAGEIECIVERFGEFEPIGDEEGEDSGVDTVAFQVFGGIGLVLGVSLLAALLFRRVWRRRRPVDEERESLWSEADPLGDLWSGLRALGGRLRRSGAGVRDPGIGGLYLEMLADAEARGTSRPTARTPRQFAPSLDQLYRSRIPGEISERFSEQRYAGREPPPGEVDRLRSSWETIVEAQT